MSLTHPNFSDRKPLLKIKVCGMCEEANIRAVSQLPIDYLGFIFYEKSPRFVEEKGLLNFESLVNLAQSKVGVFVNAEIPFVLDKVGEFGLDFVQLHGDESPEYCGNLKGVWASIKIIKAFSVNEEFDFEKTRAYESSCDLFLFDTKGKNFGGTGMVFDWQLLEKYNGQTPFLLSGGIDLNHVEDISNLNFPKMKGVDLNSRFELKPGLKDVGKLEDFVSKIRRSQT